MDSLAQQSSSTPMSDRIGVTIDLVHLSQDFVYTSQAYGKIIISEVYLPREKKTIQPISIGGVVLWEKEREGDRERQREREREKERERERERQTDRIEISYMGESTKRRRENRFDHYSWKKKGLRHHLS